MPEGLVGRVPVADRLRTVVVMGDRSARPCHLRLDLFAINLNDSPSKVDVPDFCAIGI
jgi:hypothetical protein